MKIIPPLFLCLVLIALYPLTGWAIPEIHFTEYRISLTERSRAHNYQIFNQGTTTAYCEAGFFDYFISETGGLIPAKEDQFPATSAKHLLRVSPKRVNIEPQSSQKVKVLVKDLKKKTDGEWVSYLSLRCKDAEVVLKNGLNLLPNFVFHIPVVVRKGALQATAEITEARLNSHQNQLLVFVNLRRTGNRSIYGDIEIHDENGTLLGFQKGISHYQQTTDLPLNIKIKSKPTGNVIITFTERTRPQDILINHIDAITYELIP